MKRFSPVILLLLVLLCACATGTENGGGSENELVLTANADDNLSGRRTAGQERTVANETKEFIIGVSTTGRTVNPFYCDDDDEFYVNSFINLPLLSISAQSLPVAGADVDSLAYDYEITEHEDGRATYEFIIKSGIKTADGQPIGADDLIFTLYYCLDPQYDGYITLKNRDILGLDEYAYQLSEGETKEGVVAQIQQSASSRLDKVASKDADADEQAIAVVYGFIKEAIKSDYETMIQLLSEYGYTFPELGIMGYPDDMTAELAAAAYVGALSYEDEKYIFHPATGLESDSYANYSVEEIIDGCVKYVKSVMTPAEFDMHYGWNCVTDNGNGNLSLDELCRIESQARQKEDGTRIESIAGIEKGLKKCDDGIVRETVSVTFGSINSTALWDFVMFVVPKNAFAEITSADELNEYGIVNNSVEYMRKTQAYQVKSGAGPYVMKEHNESYITLEANDNFPLGSPNVKNILLKKIDFSTSLDMVMSGEIHFARTDAASEKVNLINNDSKYTRVGYITVNYMGYGYMGINAAIIPSSYERKAILSTIDTSLAVSSYGSELCDPVHRSNTLNSWSYPSEVEAYYEFDDSGELAKSLLIQAGYMYTDGKMLDEYGTQLSYVYTLGSDVSAHPMGKTFTKSVEIMNKIGVNVTVETDRNLPVRLVEGNTAIWAAAWTSNANADIFELYCSDDRLNTSRLPNIYGLYNLGKDGSGEEKAVCIELNEGLYSIRNTSDFARKADLYAKLYDNIMELAIELPAYQKKDMFIYDRSTIDESTLLTGEKTGAYKTPEAEIWNISLLGN